MKLTILPAMQAESVTVQAASFGHSNKQIAARPVISQRIAEGYVKHIVAKFGSPPAPR